MNTFDNFYDQRKESLWMSDKEKLLRIHQMMNCKHLFVRLRDLQEEYDISCEEHPPVIQCVHCGLTNKFREDDKEPDTTIETRVFNLLYGKYYHKGWGFGRGTERFNDLWIPYLSRERLNTEHPKVLYDLAHEIDLSLDDTNPLDQRKLYSIMRELMELETKDEHEHLMHAYQASDLLERYRAKHNMSSIIR